jgi:hypothetical protein
MSSPNNKKRWLLAHLIARVCNRLMFIWSRGRLHTTMPVGHVTKGGGLVLLLQAGQMDSRYILRAALPWASCRHILWIHLRPFTLHTPSVVSKYARLELLMWSTYHLHTERSATAGLNARWTQQRVCTFLARVHKLHPQLRSVSPTGLYGPKFQNFTRPGPRTISPDPAQARSLPPNMLPVPDRRSTSFYSSPNEARCIYKRPDYRVIDSCLL